RWGVEDVLVTAGRARAAAFEVAAAVEPAPPRSRLLRRNGPVARARAGATRRGLEAVDRISHPNHSSLVRHGRTAAAMPTSIEPGGPVFARGCSRRGRRADHGVCADVRQRQADLSGARRPAGGRHHARTLKAGRAALTIFTVKLARRPGSVTTAVAALVLCAQL